MLRKQRRRRQVRRVLRTRARLAPAGRPRHHRQHGAGVWRHLGFFPVDAETLRYLERTGRDPESVALVEQYCRAQRLFRTDETPDPEFNDVLVARPRRPWCPSVAGPKRPQDLVPLTRPAAELRDDLPGLMQPTVPAARRELAQAAYSRWTDEGGAVATATAPDDAPRVTRSSSTASRTNCTTAPSSSRRSRRAPTRRIRRS